MAAREVEYICARVGRTKLPNGKLSASIRESEAELESVHAIR